MQRTTTPIPDGTQKTINKQLRRLGVDARNSAIQLIADSDDQLDLIIYSAIEAIDYDTRKPTRVCRIILATVERLQDGAWLTITSYAEDESPAQATCPAHILAMLGEPRTIQADAWRARCRHFLRAFNPTAQLNLAA